MDTCVLKAEELRTEKRELPDVALLLGCHMTSALGGEGAHLNVNSFIKPVNYVFMGCSV